MVKNYTVILFVSTILVLQVFAVAALMFFANGAVKADTLPVSPVTANTER